MTPPSTTNHISDEDLLLFQDREGDQALYEHARRHLERCGECARRAEWLRQRSAVLDARIAELDWAAPEALLPRTFAEVEHRRGGRRRTSNPRTHLLRWAAVVAAIAVSGALLVSPLRAWATDWALERWREVAAVVNPGPEPVATASEPVAASPPAAQTEYHFTPEGSEFRLHFTSPQERGAVTVETTPRAAATLRVVEGGASGDPVLVLPDRVEIRSTSSSSASYHFTVPKGVRVLRVRVGQGPWTTLEPGEFWPGEQRVLPLR